MVQCAHEILRDGHASVRQGLAYCPGATTPHWFAMCLQSVLCWQRSAAHAIEQHMLGDTVQGSDLCYAGRC